MSNNACKHCAAITEVIRHANGDTTIIEWHVNPTDKQRARAEAEGVPVGIIQERDLRTSGGD